MQKELGRYLLPVFRKKYNTVRHLKKIATLEFIISHNLTLINSAILYLFETCTSLKDHLNNFLFLVGQLKQISRAIGNELDDQAILIDSLSAEVDSAHGRMNATLAKIQRVTR